MLYLREVVKAAQKAPHLVSESRDRTSSRMETGQWGEVRAEEDSCSHNPQSLVAGMGTSLTPTSQRSVLPRGSGLQWRAWKSLRAEGLGRARGNQGLGLQPTRPVKSASHEAPPPSLPDLRALGGEPGRPRGLTRGEPCLPISAEGVPAPPPHRFLKSSTLSFKQRVIPQ